MSTNVKCPVDWREISMKQSVEISMKQSVANANKNVIDKQKH